MVRRARLAAVLITLTAALSACQSPIATHGGVSVTNSTNLNDGQIASAQQSWGAAYQRNPKDRAAILNYAAALGLAGRNDQAVAVLRKA